MPLSVDSDWDWEMVKRATAKVTASGDQSATGTAFFIGGNFALTALHVVADTTKDPPLFATSLLLEFYRGDTVQATVAGGLWDLSADWAVLECAQAPNAPLLEMQNASPQDAEWK